MRRRWVEVSCDYCGCAIQYCTPGKVAEQIREIGGIVSADGKDFCDKICRKAYRDNKKAP